MGDGGIYGRSHYALCQFAVRCDAGGPLRPPWLSQEPSHPLCGCAYLSDCLPPGSLPAGPAQQRPGSAHGNGKGKSVTRSLQLEAPGNADRTQRKCKSLEVSAVTYVGLSLGRATAPTCPPEKRGLRGSMAPCPCCAMSTLNGVNENVTRVERGRATTGAGGGKARRGRDACVRRSTAAFRTLGVREPVCFMNFGLIPDRHRYCTYLYYACGWRY